MDSREDIKRKIDELIWGNLESEIMNAKFSLYAASGAIDFAKVYPVKLLIGFLDFIHYKCGLVPKLDDRDKAEFDAIGGDFADPSSWVKFLWCVAEGDLDDPYFLRQFAEQDGDVRGVFVLMDTFSLFECGMILNRTRLEGESRFSSDEISKEFHVDEKKLPRMLLYFRHLYDTGRARVHHLVLRPTKLAEILHWLDDELRTLTNCPEQVLRTEEWEEATSTPEGRFRTLCELDAAPGCNEESFRELLKTRSIETPNVQVQTFYEYAWSILTREAAKEWEDIRDRYIAECKEQIRGEFLDPPEEDLRLAKAPLAKAREAFEGKRCTESIIQSYKAMEVALNAIEKRNMPLARKIDSVTKSHPDLRKYRKKLHFIRTARNELVRASGVNECDEDSAKFALETMDQFLICVQNSLHS